MLKWFGHGALLGSDRSKWPAVVLRSACQSAVLTITMKHAVHGGMYASNCAMPVLAESCMHSATHTLG